MTNCETKLPREYNLYHPKATLERALLRKALREIINSPRMASYGQVARWQVNPFGELESV